MKSFLKLVWLLPLLQFNPVTTDPASAGVNCNGVPHTRLEITVCSEPMLRALDAELSVAFNEVQDRGIVDRRAVFAQRNHVARQCRRVASEALHACLLNAEVASLEWAVAKLEQTINEIPVEIPASSRPGIGQTHGKLLNPTRSQLRRKGSTQTRAIDRTVNGHGWKYSASPAARISHLQRQLLVAESRLKSTGNPELTVVTLIELVQAYQRQSGHTIALTRLERSLAAGCIHSDYGKQWDRVLRENNYSCKDTGLTGRFSPADY